MSEEKQDLGLELFSQSIGIVSSTSSTGSKHFKINFLIHRQCSLSIRLVTTMEQAEK